ncbi:MAG: hypothetical protein KJO16_00795, partial [Muriicola sp.]|nr:hypothetical protein [Muriicola sp.]
NKNLYPSAIWLSLILGLSLVYFSSPFFYSLYELSGIALFKDIVANNYLFIRLGDVLIVFAVFMLLRKLIIRPTFLRIGQNTLSIYVIHFVILYGSFTGLGLYRFFHHSISPVMAISGAIAFMAVCSYAALTYDKHEAFIKGQIQSLQKSGLALFMRAYYAVSELLIILQDRLLRFFNISKG